MMDNMGLGKNNDEDDFFGGPKKKVTQDPTQARDTLGFLKRAEDEKRQKAEEKLLK